MLDATAASARTIVLLGPTAGGKSDLALELARRLGGELVSADSMQVYRGMDIGTAKPTAAERAEIPHHAIDLVDASPLLSVAPISIFARSSKGLMKRLQLMLSIARRSI